MSHSSPFIRYRNLEEIQAIHRSGYAVKHDQYPLMANQVPPEERYYYTWHSRRLAAVEELRNFGFSGESCVVAIEETDEYRRVRRVMGELRRVKARSQSRESGKCPGDTSSIAVSLKPGLIPGKPRKSREKGK